MLIIRKYLFSIVVFFLAQVSLQAQDEGMEMPPLIPRPLSVRMQPGMFSLSEKTVIVIMEENTRADADVFNELLFKLTGLKLKVMRGE